jgi:hypothetical protein
LGVKRLPADLIRRGLAGPNPARIDPPLAESRDTSSLHGQHKIISDGKIIAVAAGKTKNSWLLTPDIGNVSKDAYGTTSPRR